MKYLLVLLYDFSSFFFFCYLQIFFLRLYLRYMQKADIVGFGN